MRPPIDTAPPDVESVVQASGAVTTAPATPPRVLARDLARIALFLVLPTLILAVGHEQASEMQAIGAGAAGTYVVLLGLTALLLRRGRPTLGSAVLIGGALVDNIVTANLVTHYQPFTLMVPVLTLVVVAGQLSPRGLRIGAAVTALGGIAATLVSSRHDAAIPPGDDLWAWLLGLALVTGTVTIVVLRMEERGRASRGRIVEAHGQMAEAARQTAAERARYRALLEAYPIPMIVHDVESLGILVVNEATVTSYGWDRLELLAMRYTDLLAPGETTTAELEPSAGEPEGEPLDGPGGESQVRRMTRHRRRDGTEFAVSEVSHATDYLGRPSRIVSAADVSASVEAARERDALLRISADIVIVADLKGHPLRANAAGLEVMGGDLAPARRRGLIRSVHPDDRRAVAEGFRRTREGDQVVELEARLRGPGDTWRRFAWRASADPSRERLYATARDITAAHEREEHFRHGERVRAIGRLAGGMAHDFNNVVTAIAGHAELAAEGLPPDHPVRRDVDAIRAATAHAAGVTRRLLAFERREGGPPRLTSFDEIVASSVPILSRLLGEDVRLVTRLAGATPVIADPVQLEQVLVNLAVNARDAMADGGTITLTTSTSTSPGGRKHAVLEVGDTGAGMSPEVRARIFEPFFTTKPAGTGVGLGLATADDLVRGLGGRIEVETEPGVGTAFRVILPAAAPAAGSTEGRGRGAASAAPPNQPQRPMAPPSQAEAEIAIRPAAASGESGAPGGRPGVARATVLIAEDESAIRNLVTRVLEGEGYRVLAAADAAEARSIVNAFGGTIDLLVCDVVMPGGNGRDLARELRERLPGLAVLMTSGYDVAAPAAGSTEEPFLAKPYLPGELVRQVAMVLTQTRDSARDGAAVHE